MLRPAEPVTCFRLQEVLCDLGSISTDRVLRKTTRKMNRGGGKEGTAAWCAALTVDQLTEMKLKRVLIVAQASAVESTRPHYDLPMSSGQRRSSWVSVRTRAEQKRTKKKKNPLTWSGTEAGRRPATQPGMGRLRSCVSCSLLRHLIIYFTIAILLNELLQELDLKSRIHLWSALERRASRLTFLILFFDACLSDIKVIFVKP